MLQELIRMVVKDFRMTNNGHYSGGPKRLPGALVSTVALGVMGLRRRRLEKQAFSTGGSIGVGRENLADRNASHNRWELVIPQFPARFPGAASDRRHLCESKPLYRVYRDQGADGKAIPSSDRQ